MVKFTRFFPGLLFFLREPWSIWIGESRKAEQRLDKRLGFLNETDEFFWKGLARIVAVRGRSSLDPSLTYGSFEGLLLSFIFQH